ncbi:uncharacterized protein EAE97_004796 [Botrytis byssoidea]|uniref:BTB domain-containing protein n=1 Tax=Botrytis byssoidea TaxID=139641 RepID=A0A9P5M629_9HELO|nr:uncharacterized protein EAE97_004796 [Botrytis byssoidea]KAF7945758.1 hypothetical protein EAE97_004796 [Botrytis byssoidea]
MAASSSAHIIVDPDGDLFLLLNPTIPNSTKSDYSSLADPEAINAPTDDISTELQMIRSLEGGMVQTWQDEPPPIYSDHILVSSKHMCLASPVFKAMLQGEFKQSVTLKTMGKLEVPLPDDNPTAMKILINIIHGRMSMVPLKIALELFCQIAILVDKYQCREIVQLLPPVWKNEFSHTFSQGQWVDIVHWVCIAWQFELEDEFLKATQIIRERSSWTMENLIGCIKYDLPIPNYVVGKFSVALSTKSLTFPDKIESCRLEGMRKVCKIIQDTITKYQSSSYSCSATNIPWVIDTSDKHHGIANDLPSYRNDCDSMVLGSLIKSSVSNGLYPLPEQPYTLWSLNSLTAKVKLLKADSLCFKLTQEKLEDHNITGSIRKSVKAIDKSGLSLSICKELAFC